MTTDSATTTSSPITVDCTSILPESGGVGSVAAGVARGLLELGREVVCLTVPQGQARWMEAFADLRGVEIRTAAVALSAESKWQRALRSRMPQRLRQSAVVGAIRRVRGRSLMKRVPDHVTWLPFHRAFLASSRGVVTVHDLRVFDPELASTMDQRIVADNIARARAVVCSWPHPTAHLVTLFPEADAKTFQIALPLLNPGQPVRRRLTDGEPLRLLYPGFVTPHKNHETLIRAMVDMPDAQLVLTGADDGRHAADMRRLAGALGLQHRIEWRGRVSTTELETAYAEAHVLVMPTRWEAASGPVFEAIARQLPFVASDIAPIRSQLEAIGVTAPLFEWNDPRALAKSVGEVVSAYDDSQDRLRAPGAILRKRTWADTAAEYMSVFDWVAGRADRPTELAADRGR